MRPTNPNQGLSHKEAYQRLQLSGYNELPRTLDTGVAALLLRIFREPMTLLLLACASLYTILGDTREAAVLGVFILIMIAISLYQELKAERALNALRDLAQPSAQVIRDGESLRVASRDLVVGDVICMNEGDRVGADAILLEGLNIQIDESLLSGESVPVSKFPFREQGIAMPEAMGSPAGDASYFVFAGSLVTRGKGRAQVLATGHDTVLGKIGHALISIETSPTRVQREIRRVIHFVAVLSLALAFLLTLIYGVTRGDWLRAALSGLSFAMALIPQELPVVLTLFFALGAWRIAQKQVLTRRAAAIELLGATTLLCVDKTGTLTQNKMRLAHLHAQGIDFDCGNETTLPEALHTLLEIAILACHRHAFDPMETAIHGAGKTYLHELAHRHSSWELIEEYPLSRELMAMSRVWFVGAVDADTARASFAGRIERRGNVDQNVGWVQYQVACKGAPEAVAELCHLSSDQRIDLMAQVTAYAERGLRVLAVAQACLTFPSNTINTQTIPSNQHDYTFQFVGILAFEDPVREQVPMAIARCRAAGIRVVMMTGDYPATAVSIAQQAGLDVTTGYLSGAEIAILSETQLARKIQTTSIFCRVTPDQKLRLILAYKKLGEIVAMTGDGVNDASALKAAHIGIAMGKRGTDVAREAAALVLFDDNFTSIVNAIKEGRRIFDNLKKTVSFFIAVHIPIVGVAFVPILMGWPQLLMPIHILVFELLIDPTCALAFEAESIESNAMTQAPRGRHAGIFESEKLWFSAIEGFSLLSAVLVLYSAASLLAVPEDEARAMTYVCMITGNIGLILINRSYTGRLIEGLLKPNPVLPWVISLCLGIVTVACFVPPMSRLFYFGNPTWTQLMVAIAVGVLSSVGISGLHVIRGWLATPLQK